MRALLIATIFLASTHFGLAAKPAAAPPAKGGNMRTFLGLNGYSREALRNGVSRKFYKSLTISPLEAYIVARAPVHDYKSSNAKITHSEAGGVFDPLALELANSMVLKGLNRTESRIQSTAIDVHLLIYMIADGIMAVGVAHVDDSKYADYRQFGRATIGFYKNGQWTFMPNDLPQKR